MRSKGEIMSNEGSNIAGEKTNIESEPRVCAADEDLEVCPFAIVIGKVLPRGLGGFDTLNLGVWVDVEGTGLEEVIDILGCLVDIALDIHAAILTKLPDCVEVIISWANLERRQNGTEAAIQVLKDQIDAPTVDLYTKAALVAEWAILLWKGKNSTEEARAVFLKNVQWYADSRTFWDKWFQLELEQAKLGMHPCKFQLSKQ